MSASWTRAPSSARSTSSPNGSTPTTATPGRPSAGSSSTPTGCRRAPPRRPTSRFACLGEDLLTVTSGRIGADVEKVHHPVRVPVLVDDHKVGVGDLQRSNLRPLALGERLRNARRSPGHVAQIEY